MNPAPSLLPEAYHAEWLDVCLSLDESPNAHKTPAPCMGVVFAGGTASTVVAPSAAFADPRNVLAIRAPRASLFSSSLDDIMSTHHQDSCGAGMRLLSRHSSFLMSGSALFSDLGDKSVLSELRPQMPLSTSEADLAVHEQEVPFLSPASDTTDTDAFFEDEDGKPEAKEAGKKIYACIACNKTYTTSEGLRLHVRGIHLNDRNSKCDFCGRGFVRQSDLKLHVMRIHQDSRPFECVECSKSFACRSELKRHTNIHRRKMDTAALRVAKAAKMVDDF